MDNQETVDEKKKMSRRTKIALGVLLGLIVLIVISVSIISAMVLGPAEKFNTPELTEDARGRCIELFNKIMTKAGQSKPGQVSEITLSPADVNAIIATIGNVDNFNKVVFGGHRDTSKINYKAGYSKGKFDVTYIANTKIKTPFGSHVKIAFSCTPEMSPASEHITVHNASLGSLSIPAQRVETDFNNELARRKGTKYYKLVRQIIIKTNINDDYSITITYYPYQFKKMLTSQSLQSLI